MDAVRGVRMSGPLTPYVEGFAAELRSASATHRSCRWQISFDCWPASAAGSRAPVLGRARSTRGSLCDSSRSGGTRTRSSTRSARYGPCLSTLPPLVLLRWFRRASHGAGPFSTCTSVTSSRAVQSAKDTSRCASQWRKEFPRWWPAQADVIDRSRRHAVRRDRSVKSHRLSVWSSFDPAVSVRHQAAGGQSRLRGSEVAELEATLPS